MFTMPVFSNKMTYEELEALLTKFATDDVLRYLATCCVKERFDLLPLVVSKCSFSLRTEMRSWLPGVDRYQFWYVIEVMKVLGFTLKHVNWRTLLDAVELSVEDVKLAVANGAEPVFKRHGAQMIRILDERASCSSYYRWDYDENLYAVANYISKTFCRPPKRKNAHLLPSREEVEALLADSDADM